MDWARKTDQEDGSHVREQQRPAAETLCAEELARLAEADRENPRPPGWRLSQRAALDFVLAGPGCEPKFLGTGSTRRSSKSGSGVAWFPPSRKRSGYRWRPVSGG